MTTSIRLAVSSDLPRILALANWAALETTANFATEPESLEEWHGAWERTHAEYPWLVASASTHDGQVVGFAKGGPHRARGAYAWAAEVTVYVDPTWHRKRVGETLYGALIRTMRAQGFVTLLAGITDGHVGSERLHAKCGFARCGTFHRVGWKHGAWRDVGYWELALSSEDRAPSPRRRVDEVFDG